MMESFWNFLQLESAAGRGSELSAWRPTLGGASLARVVWGDLAARPQTAGVERAPLLSLAALFGSGEGPVPPLSACAVEKGQVQATPLPQPPGFPLGPSPPPRARNSVASSGRGGGGGRDQWAAQPAR
ncbi:hypothetical protein P7K49_015789 [Saguinus oedipus]|uniref:Uncharacterized protein n=1 Tax=Saguinus oedipus TaxID=9490 RepID=A0ABQ9VB12_SAGOE|nr:hypothetical protein P7K49_015789 [Saguinus oedipus]